MIFKIKFQKKGAHIHCDLYCQSMPNSTWAGCGYFCVREEEFIALQMAMGGVMFESRVKAERESHVQTERHISDIG